MAPENGGEFSGSLEVPRYWKAPFLGGDLLVLGRVNDFVSLRIQTCPGRVGLMVSIPSPCHRIQSGSPFRKVSVVWESQGLVVWSEMVTSQHPGCV